MFNLVDIVQMKLTDKKREDIEEILTAAIDGTKEYIEAGHDVYWLGLCRFTWKKRAKTKKEATNWTEFPYMADGPKVRFVPEDDLDMDAKGEVLRIKKGTNYGKEESK